MCLAVNGVFELFDPLEGKVSFLIFFLFILRWNNLLPGHESHLLKVFCELCKPVSLMFLIVTIMSIPYYFS